VGTVSGHCHAKAWNTLCGGHVSRLLSTLWHGNRPGGRGVITVTECDRHTLTCWWLGIQADVRAPNSTVTRSLCSCCCTGFESWQPLRAWRLNLTARSKMATRSRSRALSCSMGSNTSIYAMPATHAGWLPLWAAFEVAICFSRCVYTGCTP
jgi:hypothetical protein